NLIQPPANAATAPLRGHDQPAQKTDWYGRVVREDSAQAFGLRHPFEHVMDGQPGGPNDVAVCDGDPVPSTLVERIDHVVQHELNRHLGSPATQAQADDYIERSPL